MVGQHRLTATPLPPRPRQNFVPGTFLDQSVDTISYSDFVHKARAVWLVEVGCACPAPAQWSLWLLLLPLLLRFVAGHHVPLQTIPALS